MKTLVNRHNTSCRIISPDIREMVDFEEDYWSVPELGILLRKTDWRLVEEEKEEEEILEDEIQRYKDVYFANKAKGFNLDSIDVQNIAKHFYELGKGGKI